MTYVWTECVKLYVIYIHIMHTWCRFDDDVSGSLDRILIYPKGESERLGPGWYCLSTRHSQRSFCDDEDVNELLLKTREPDWCVGGGQSSLCQSVIRRFGAHSVYIVSEIKVSRGILYAMRARCLYGEIVFVRIPDKFNKCESGTRPEVRHVDRRRESPPFWTSSAAAAIVFRSQQQCNEPTGFRFRPQ